MSTRRARGAFLAEIAALLDRPEGCTVPEASAVTGIGKDDVSTRLKKAEEQGHIVGRKDSADTHKRYFRTLAQANAAPLCASVIERYVQRPGAIRKAGQPVVLLKPEPVGARANGQPVFTKRTVYTLDTTKRPNNKIEAMPDLPPDPRWPSFSDEWRQRRGQA